jgi:hypothetical protein
VSLFSEFPKLAGNLESVFGNRWSRENALLLIKHNSFVKESPMCMYMMCCDLPFKTWNRMLILLRSKSRPKFHISKVSLGYFYCDVQLCVGYGRDV